jgi:hypothetical protein
MVYVVVTYVLALRDEQNFHVTERISATSIFGTMLATSFAPVWEICPTAGR